MPHLSSLDHLVLTVSDMTKTTAFYVDVLGMRVVQFTAGDGTQRTSLTFGKQKINLHQKGQEFDPKSARPTPGAADLCFLTQTPLAAWIKHLETHAVPVIEGPVERTGATGPIRSIYIRDPDQNLIEISNSMF